MAGVAAVIPKQQFSSSAGVPLANGTVDVYLAGSTTRTPSYQDSALSTANANPIALDSGGYATIWLDSTLTYKLVAKNSAGATQWTEDNVTGAGNSLAAFTFTQSGTGAVARTGQAKMRDILSVKDFGAVGDGVTDDTAAVQRAVDASTGYFGGTFCEVFFPNGNYVLGNLQLRTGTKLRGTSKYGCWLTAKTGATSILETANQGAASAVNGKNQIIIEGFTIRYDGLVSHTDNAAIRLWNSYGNTVRDCYIYADNEKTNLAWGLYCGQGVYTSTFENVHCNRVRIYSPTADRPTTLTFLSLSGAFMDIDNAGSITLLQPVFQSSVANNYGTYRIKVVNCFTFTAIGGDFEDDAPGNFIYYIDNVTESFVSIGNWTDSAFAGGYAVYGGSGITGTALLQDDPANRFGYKTSNWTPSLAWSTPGTSSFVYGGTRAGYYMKLGRMVVASFVLDDVTFTNGTASGYLTITGLPFAAKTKDTDSYGGTITLNIGYPVDTQAAVVLTGTTTMALKRSNGLGSSVVVADVSGAGKYLRATVTYEAAT